MVPNDFFDNGLVVFFFALWYSVPSIIYGLHLLLCGDG